MARVLLVGIDGLDWPLLKSMLHELPTFKKIAASGFAGQMDSIFPPDSIPSWISIFTGLDPSQHGLLDSVDYFKKDANQFSVDTSIFQGKTFWDKAGSLGKKVIVVNPLMAHPPWKVNGIMVSGPVFMSGETSSYPANISDNIEIPPLGGIVGFPKKSELVPFYENTKKETSEIVDFTCNLMKQNDWDLTFLTLLTMDRVCHFYWRYFDKNDPTYPGKTKLANIVPDFLRFLDDCLKQLLSATDEETIVMLISDHGHAMRPAHFFNLNQLLMDNGYVTSKVKQSGFLKPKFFIEKAKDFTLETLHKLDMEDLAYKLAKLLPFTKKLKDSSFMTNPETNLATASSFGGSNPFGGVEISKEMCLLQEKDYETIREDIISLLLSSKDDKDVPYFLWAKKREEVYKGEFIDKFPDVLYELRPELGTNWSLHLPLVTINPRHKKISGGHRKNSILVAGPLNEKTVDPQKAISINIAESVLHLLFDGKPINEITKHLTKESFFRSSKEEN